MSWHASSGSGLILLAFITRNNSLESLLEGLLAQIHIDSSRRGFWPESNLGPVDNPNLLSPVLFSTEQW